MTSSEAALIDRFGDETTHVVCQALNARWGSFCKTASGQRPFRISESRDSF